LNPKIHLGWDIDDVLGDRVQAWDRWLARNGYPTILPKNLASYDCAFNFECSRQEALQRLDRIYESEEFANMVPYPEAQVVLRDLAEYQHSAITGRVHWNLPMTRSWIERHFPGQFSGVFTIEASPCNGRKAAKADMCSRIGAQLLIEDAPMHVEACLERGIVVLLLEKPWNTKFILEHQRLHRLKTLLDIPGVVRQLEFELAGGPGVSNSSQKYTQRV
jgi:5' nucleotidase, deoxy (Pyrimidine), cytosolic type C protein (NT5C)